MNDLRSQRWKHVRFLVVLIFSLPALLLSIPSAAGGLPSIPDEIPAKGSPRDHGKPIWLAADRAITAGELRKERFHPSVLSDLEWAKKPKRAAADTRDPAQRPSHPGNGLDPDDSLCSSFVSSSNEWVVEDFSYESLMRHAELAVVGTVLSEREGFLYGYDTTLLNIEVDRVLKAPEDAGEISTLYMSYPQSSIEVGDEMLCRRGPRYPHQPVVGRHVLLFAATIPEWDPIIVNPVDDELFFENAEGEVIFPSHVGEFVDPPLWLEFVGENAENAASNLVSDR